MPLMTQDVFSGHATAPGARDELVKAFTDKIRAAFFIREGTTVYYAIAADDVPYDPLWALFGSGYKPRKAYCTYSNRSNSESGILSLLGEFTEVIVADAKPAAAALGSKAALTFRKITM